MNEVKAALRNVATGAFPLDNMAVTAQPLNWN